MKKIVAMLSAIAMVATIAVASVASAAADKGAATYTIDFNGKGKKVENFQHHKHQERTTCKECHHKDKEGETPKACANCHKEKKEGEVVAMKDAMHKNCIDCHKKGKKGPAKCDECHGK